MTGGGISVPCVPPVTVNGFCALVAKDRKQSAAKRMALPVNRFLVVNVSKSVLKLKLLLFCNSFNSSHKNIVIFFEWCDNSGIKSDNLGIFSKIRRKPVKKDGNRQKKCVFFKKFWRHGKRLCFCCAWIILRHQSWPPVWQDRNDWNVAKTIAGRLSLPIKILQFTF